MEFKKVAIIGAGAVGAYLLWGLSNKKDIDLCLVAQGQRKERLETEGVLINDVLYHPIVRTPEEASDPDLLIVTVKYNALQETLADIKKIVGKNTTVMSLLNGVDSEEVIGKSIGEDKIVHSLIKIASERNGNQVKFDAEGTLGIIYGEINPEGSDDRVMAIEKLFKGTGLHYRITDNILKEIWSKFLLNVMNNQPQAIVGCGVGCYKDSEHMAFLREKLGEEVVAIAKEKGVHLSLMDGITLKGAKVLPRARYSTLQDLDAGRHTEVDMFAGAVVRMGQEVGVATPYNEFVFHMIKALEEKHDGKFDYE